jgi:hypothetical protein
LKQTYVTGQESSMFFKVVSITASAALLLSGLAVAQIKQYPLDSIDGLILNNVSAEPVSLNRKTGVRLTLSEDGKRRLEQMSPAERERRGVQQFAKIRDLDFSSGVIEVELAGAPATNAPAAARGFVGIAFRLQPDNETYDAFYLRPTNGRADEVKVKIDVRGGVARLYVDGNVQPTVVVSDVKSGADATGGIALWLDTGTVAHFRNLTSECHGTSDSPRPEADVGQTAAPSVHARNVLEPVSTAVAELLLFGTAPIGRYR